jgi:hypothetical protein
MTITTALAGIGSQITLVKNNNGEVYWPDYGFNAIGSMVVGQGYKVHMKQAALLTYPAAALTKRSTLEKIAGAPIHYKLQKRSGANAVLLVKSITMNGVVLQDSSDVGAFDEKGILVGSGRLTNGAVAFAIWADNPSTPEKDGYTQGEHIVLKLWTLSGELPLETASGKELTFSANAIYAQELVVPLNKLKTKFALNRFYPNPFMGRLFLGFDVPMSGRFANSNVEISLYDLHGRVAGVIAKGSFAPGRHDIVWDAPASVGAGMYILRMKAENFVAKTLLYRIK